MKRITGTVGVYYTLEQLRVFIYKESSSIFMCYLGGAPIPQIQDAIWNPPNHYFKILTVRFRIRLNFHLYVHPLHASYIHSGTRMLYCNSEVMKEPINLIHYRRISNFACHQYFTSRLRIKSRPRALLYSLTRA